MQCLRKFLTLLPCYKRSTLAKTALSIPSVPSTHLLTPLPNPLIISTLSAQRLSAANLLAFFLFG